MSALDLDVSVLAKFAFLDILSLAELKSNFLSICFSESTLTSILYTCTQARPIPDQKYLF